MKTCNTCCYQHDPGAGDRCRRCQRDNLTLPLWTPIRSYAARPAAKPDQGKARWDLLPWPAVEGVVQVLTAGAPSHGERGWRTLPNARDRYFAAMMRHAMAWLKGETRDAESGLHPLVHVAANALILADLVRAEGGP